MNLYWLYVETDDGMLFAVKADGTIEYGPSYAPALALEALVSLSPPP